MLPNTTSNTGTAVFGGAAVATIAYWIIMGCPTTDPVEVTAVAGAIGSIVIYIVHNLQALALHLLTAVPAKETPSKETVNEQV